MNTSEQNIEIANTIMAQLGGRRFKVMTGARDIFALESGVGFKIPGSMTKNHINYVAVTLEESDTYKMEFIKYGRRNGTFYRDIISEFDMVYDDMLENIFKSETGLDTRL